MKPAASAAEAGWLAQALPGYAGTVDSLVPPGFEAYVRLLHPALQQHRGGNTLVTWKQIGERAGRQVDGATQWEHLEALLPDDCRSLLQPPEEGCLDPTYLALVCQAIRPLHPRGARCCFGVWSGYENAIDEVRNAPTFQLWGEGYRLLEGDLRCMEQSACRPPFYQSPNVLWPADRTWFMTTEVDFRSTYFGGSTTFASALLTAFPGSAFPISPGARVTLHDALM